MNALMHCKRNMYDLCISYVELYHRINKFMNELIENPNLYEKNQKDSFLKFFPENKFLHKYSFKISP